MSEADALLRVEFEATLDERVDVAQRLGQRLPSLRGRLLRQRIAAGVFLALASLLLPAMPGESPSPWLRAGIAAALFTCGFLFTGRSLRESRRRAMATALREFDGKDDVHCAVELRHAGVHVLQDGVGLSWPWSDLRTVEGDTGDVTLLFRQGMLVVRSRAFATAGQRQRFLDILRQYGPASP